MKHLHLSGISQGFNEQDQKETRRLQRQLLTEGQERAFKKGIFPKIGTKYRKLKVYRAPPHTYFTSLPPCTTPASHLDASHPPIFKSLRPL